MSASHVRKTSIKVNPQPSTLNPLPSTLASPSLKVMRVRWPAKVHYACPALDRFAALDVALVASSSQIKSGQIRIEAYPTTSTVSAVSGAVGFSWAMGLITRRVMASTVLTLTLTLTLSLTLTLTLITRRVMASTVKAVMRGINVKNAPIAICPS